MPLPKTKSINEIFGKLKKETGHKACHIQTEFMFGWLLYTGHCKYCGFKIQFYTMTECVMLNGQNIGRYNRSFKSESNLCQFFKCML